MTRIDPGGISLVAELHSYDRQAAEELGSGERTSIETGQLNLSSG
jgi:hypothetical protein